MSFFISNPLDYPFLSFPIAHNIHRSASFAKPISLKRIERACINGDIFSSPHVFFGEILPFGYIEQCDLDLSLNRIAVLINPPREYISAIEFITRATVIKSISFFISLSLSPSFANLIYILSSRNESAFHLLIHSWILSASAGCVSVT